MNDQNQTLEQLEKELAAAKSKMILGIVFLAIAQVLSTISFIIAYGGAL